MPVLGERTSAHERLTDNDRPGNAVQRWPVAQTVKPWRCGSTMVMARQPLPPVIFRFTMRLARRPLKDTPGVLAAENATETAPSMAIAANGFGIAVWVHDADTNPSTVSDRYLASDYWNEGAWEGMRIRDDWPAGVLYPQAAFAPDGQAVVVFTAREQDEEANTMVRGRATCSG